MKWEKVMPIMKYGLFIPHVVMLFTNLAWHTTVRPVRDEYHLENNCFIVV